MATAPKAHSILAFANEDVDQFRTGEAAENAAIWAANTMLGYMIDGEWATLTPAELSRAEDDQVS